MPIECATDILLALLYAKGSEKENEEVRGTTRLEKLLFLLSKEGGFSKYLENEYRFVAYDFGPFSDEIYDDIEMLKDGELIETIKDKREYYAEDVDRDESIEQADLEETEKDVSIYRLTPNGIKVARHLFENELTKEERNRITEIKKKFNSMPFYKFLKYVYERYPEMTTKSMIKDDLR